MSGAVQQWKKWVPFRWSAVKQKVLQRSSSEEGLTLIELLAVVVILGIIAAIAVPVVSSAVNESKVNSTVATLGTIEGAIEHYQFDHGVYPTKLSDLTGTSTGQNGATVGPYLQGTPPVNDGWGNPIYYAQVNNGTGYILVSGDGRQVTVTGSSPNIVLSTNPSGSSYVIAAGGSDATAPISQQPTVIDTSQSSAPSGVNSQLFTDIKAAVSATGSALNFQNN